MFRVRVNGCSSLETSSVLEMLRRVGELQVMRAAGPVTVEQDGRQRTAVQVEELFREHDEALALHD